MYEPRPEQENWMYCSLTRTPKTDNKDSELTGIIANRGALNNKQITSYRIPEQLQEHTDKPSLKHINKNNQHKQNIQQIRYKIKRKQIAKDKNP